MSKAEQEAILAQQAEQLLLAAGQTLEGFDTPEEIIEKVRGLFENIPVPVPADGSGTEQPPGSGQTVSSQGIVCPVNVPGRIVMTQGYGVGSHVPAQVFGAIDLAVDGDGDGAADVPGTHRAPLVAAFDGVVYAVTEEHNGNRYVSIKNADGRRFAYSHLDEYIVSSGQVVVRGQQIGYIGDTGYSFGDHLDIQYWVPNGSGGEVNTDPTAMLREACGFP
jgi:murein DD-endopeptidase MepM/ murein hydrolase activator NlpD